jgi:hypothetical protein
MPFYREVPFPCLFAFFPIMISSFSLFRFAAALFVQQPCTWYRIDAHPFLHF